uniref:Beta-lactamase-related domain-containing protein n=2 Tax=Branchiostoma floridae TaxID=7739 RepID=C3YNA2_BRAFL|eukprot:XP_002602196.1 hypothetical protein BRAFLDRAFT_76883 [Branchiostoma floridae]
MLRVCEKLREADAKGRRYGLARAVTGYLRALVDAVADKDRLAEVELLKSLGDVNLEKGRLEKDVGRFNMALALYVAAMVRCGYRDQGDGIEHRYEYAERLLQGVTSKGSQGQEQQTEDKETTTPAKVALKFQNLDKKRTAGGNTDSMLVGYAQLIVEGIVNENNMLQTEAIKSLGDVYLKRGTETRDTRDLTRATALYNTALARCNNVQVSVAIVHRLLYTAKIRQDITTKSIKKSTRTQRQQDVQKRKDHASPFSTATSSDNTNDRMRRPHSVYEEHLQDGCRALQTGDLDKAEQSFAAALKSVHIQGQHMEEAETLYMLGRVYLKRGIQSKDGGDFTKAAALCNAALVRSSREDIEEAIKEITHAFVKEVLKIEQKVDSDDTEKHKLMLKADRGYVQEEITRIEQEVDPYSLADEDPKIKDVEMKRVEAIKTLCQTLVHQREVFIAGLVDECMGVMRPPPCKYAMIGLGSQATGLVTPYSDLEFALLVDKETEENVSYFRNLTHYLHLKVINLGETILPAMAIKSLNDFYSDDPLDSWFYDSVTPRGFAFDGAMPHACKTPLGRGRNSRGTSELIRTPSNMTNVLKEDLTLHLKKGYHLASILGNVSFITGDQGLVDEYRSLWAQQLQNNNGIVPLVMAINLLGENVSTFQSQALTAELRNVKTEIYRFSSLAVSFLALLHNIQPTTIWETIQELRNSGVIDSENSHHLMVLVSISAELRLRTYMSNRGQVENMSVLWSMSTNTGIEEKLQKVFYISNPKQLMRYYYTERPLKHFISQLTDAQSLKEPPIFFDNSSELKAKVYKSLCDFENLKKCSEQTLHNYLSKYGENTAHGDVAASLVDLAFALMTLGDHKKAVRYYEQLLQMRWSMYGKGTAHPDIADSISDLSAAWSFLGDHGKALYYFEQSLQMRRSIYGEDNTHPDIAASLNNLGEAWRNLGDYRKAVSYYEQALEMRRSIYGEDTAHPNIAASLNNLGATWSNLGDNRKAISYYEQALEMRRSIYGEDTAHPNIADSLNNLGATWSNLGDNRKAISYYEQSLQMKLSIYGEDTAHPDFASSLNNLGGAWTNLGDHRKAISYYEQALEMMRGIYGEDTVHPNIAASLNNLGSAWRNLGDHRKAVSYFDQALEMRRSIYGKNTAHPDIAQSLNNMGNAWGNLGDHRKAISYYEQSLQMKRSIYGEVTIHPGIAASLYNLGATWSDLGDHRKAISYYEQALQMMRSIYVGQVLTMTSPDLQQRLQDLHTFIQNLMTCESRPVVGLTVSVVKNGQTIFAKGYGQRDLQTGQAVDNRTLFGVGSISKSFTPALLAGILGEREDVSWDTVLTDILGPSFRFRDQLRTEEATIRDLLAHKIALENLLRMRYYREIYPFRTTFRYNDVMYTLAAHVAEKLAGKPFETLLRERILQPLGMNDTVYLAEALEAGDFTNFAQTYLSYNRSGESEMRSREEYRSVKLHLPAAGVVSNALDMARYMKFHLSGGRDTAGRLVVPEDTLRQTQTASAVMSSYWDKVEPYWPVEAWLTQGYGMGLSTGSYRGYGRVYHRGSMVGFTSLLSLYPSASGGVFTSLNGPTTTADNIHDVIHYQVSDILTGKDHWLNSTTACTYPAPWWTTRQTRSTAVPKISDNFSRDKRDYEGVYGNHATGNLTITLNTTDNKLYFRLGLIGRGVVLPTESANQILFRAEEPLEYIPNIIADVEVKGGEVFSLSLQSYPPEPSVVFERGLKLTDPDPTEPEWDDCTGVSGSPDRTASSNTFAFLLFLAYMFTV